MRLTDAAALEALRPRIAEPARWHLGLAATLWREVMAGPVQLY